MMDITRMSMRDIIRKLFVENVLLTNKDPIIAESITTTTKNNSKVCPLLNELKNSNEEKLLAMEAELDLMWDKIQELKETDPFAAQVMYLRYKTMANDLPPPNPTHIIEDQAVS
jgi:hypothetical protein